MIYVSAALRACPAEKKKNSSTTASTTLHCPRALVRCPGWLGGRVAGCRTLRNTGGAEVESKPSPLLAPLSPESLCFTFQPYSDFCWCRTWPGLLGAGQDLSPLPSKIRPSWESPTHFLCCRICQRMSQNAQIEDFTARFISNSHARTPWRLKCLTTGLSPSWQVIYVSPHPFCLLNLPWPPSLCVQILLILRGSNSASFMKSAHSCSCSRSLQPLNPHGTLTPPPRWSLKPIFCFRIILFLHIF